MIPPELVMVVIALLLLPAVLTGIRLQRVPFMMVEYVALVLLVLLIVGYHNGGRSPLEKVDVCTPAATAWPRAPRPSADLAGCPGYVAPVIDSNRDIPVSDVPDIRATPSWAADPGR